MKSRLLASFLTVLLFWWIFFLFRWGLGSLQDNFQSLINLKKLLPFLNIKMPESGLSQALYIQLAVLRSWTVPLTIIGGVSTIIGSAIVWMYAVRYNNERKERVKPIGSWRGAYIGKIGGGGKLPEPTHLNRMKLPNESLLSHSKVQSLKEMEIVLLREILETIYAYPEAFCGDGHATTLYQHTLNVLNQLINNPKVTGKMLIVAAAHDMGKITAFKKNDKGKWDRVKMHDKESANLLALVPSFWQFDEMDRRVMLLATKYTHSPGNMPSFDPEDRINKMAMDILNIIHEADKQATKEEKQRVLDKAELEKLVLECFLNVLPTLHFQKPGLPKGAISSGWKIKGRIYLNEIQVRETCMKNLDKDIRAALGGNYREKTELTPFTSALLKAFANTKWLVTEINGKKVESNEALWKIKAGTREFNGVIIIDNLPAKIKDMLDPSDTTYKLEVLGPQFEKEIVEADTLGLFKADKQPDKSVKDKEDVITMTPKDESHKKGFVDSSVLALDISTPTITPIQGDTEEELIPLAMPEPVIEENTSVSKLESHSVIQSEVTPEKETDSIATSEEFSISGFLGDALANEEPSTEVLDNTPLNATEPENLTAQEDAITQIVVVEESVVESTNELAINAQKLIDEANQQKKQAVNAKKKQAVNAKKKQKNGDFDGLFK